MSELLKRMKDDLHKSMKAEVEFRKIKDTTDVVNVDTEIAVKDVVRSIISMFPEIGVKPDKATDVDVNKLLKKYLFIEKTRELYIQKFLTEDMVKDLSASKLNSLIKEKISDLGDRLTSLRIEVVYNYLPKQVEVSSDEIKKWIKDNIDFDSLKNKMQAMGPTMKQFQGVDGTMVRKIIEGM